jgi:Tfp pilus assembly protein PilX
LRIRGQRRGAIGVASVIVLVVVQLLLVGAIIAGTREADTTMQRMDTLRAFYAAEGGMNMAIREMLSNLDEDGDGDIGTISNDALLTDDPAVGNAHVYVVQSVNGGTTTLVSRGRCGLARRQLTTDIE